MPVLVHGLYRERIIIAYVSDALRIAWGQDKHTQDMFIAIIC